MRVEEIHQGKEPKTVHALGIVILLSAITGLGKTSDNTTLTFALSLKNTESRHVLSGLKLSGRAF